MSTEPTRTSATGSEPMPDIEALISDYLDRLRRASTRLPAATRAELLDDITAHLAETIRSGADEGRARQVLDELGAPEEIAAAAAAESGTPVRTSGERVYDVATPLILLLGNFVVPVLGWVAGVAMLWNGPRWNTRQKWIGTLIWPVITLLFLAAVLIHRGLLVMPAVMIFGLAGLVAELIFLLRAAARQQP
ncbi:hypothetical protein AB0878_36830 [Amycolatopsis sp. NPDC047767]|uniref:HAAS signaling domain-containing protein n=1 Tax=Amycolatopsis sp. NPDC047767 TaxID=3156765 RepID=UPI0034551A5B